VANDVRIQARLYTPFAYGSQFLGGTLVLSRSIQGTTLEIPVSAMRAGGTGALDRDFPLGAIVLTIDGPLTLSSVSLRCPPKAFVNLEKSDYEMDLVGEPSPQRVLSTASTQMNGSTSARSPTQGTKQPTPFFTPTQTPQPAAVCGNGIIEAGEECDSGIAILNPACENCKVVCSKAGGGASRLEAATTPSECGPPPTCVAPYKMCSSTSKHGGSQCCYDPETEDCVTFKSYGHPIAKCAPKKGSCKEPNAKECKSGKGDRACCPSDSTSECAQGGGVAICSFSACGPNQTPCTTATGLISEATLCCSNETEECTDTVEILGHRIKACAAKPTACVNAGGTVCMGNGTPRCCRAGTVCSPSVDGLANCVKSERTIPEPADATL
jgi:hypothetical protein